MTMTKKQAEHIMVEIRRYIWSEHNGYIQRRGRGDYLVHLFKRGAPDDTLTFASTDAWDRFLNFRTDGMRILGGLENTLAHAQRWAPYVQMPLHIFDFLPYNPGMTAPTGFGPNGPIDSATNPHVALLEFDARTCGHERNALRDVVYPDGTRFSQNGGPILARYQEKPNHGN